ncbi:MAG: LuxR family transcriptional regulator [Kiritimatiellae bacterium]|nr:LuxR family transcriptional regulator [Kiritimatiellia bacterium]
MPGAREALRTAALAFEAPFYMLMVRGATTSMDPVQLIISNYPKDLQRRYDEMNAWTFDPVLDKALKTTEPFQWDELFETPRQKALLREYARYGMARGMTASYRGSESSVAILCFCGHRHVSDNAELWKRTKAALILLTATLQRTVHQLIKSRDCRLRRLQPNRALSETERRCVQLIAMGRTAEQTAVVLGVKTRTIGYYLDRVAEKLGATSRKEAVALAISSHLVETRRYPPLTFARDRD